MSLGHKLAKVSEGNAVILLSVELKAQKKNREDVIRSDACKQQVSDVVNKVNVI